MEPRNDQQQQAPADDPPPRLPPLGSAGLGALAPMHTSPFAIETNVSRIATQIAEGRQATYD
jgi:hypothetical protein